MSTTQAANYLEQSQRRARQFLDTNNSLTSKVSDEMISLLSAGEGSFYLRDQIDNILNNIVEMGGNATLGYNRAKMRQLMSIKDKIAYTTAIMRTTAYGSNPGDVIAEEADIKETLNDVINQLDQRLIDKQEFTESRILRHAAINRFSCRLDTAERAKLNTFATKVKKLCSDEGFDILAEAVHFTFESDAQKIIKLYEVISQLSAMGVTIPADIVKDFSGSGEKDKDGNPVDGFERHILKLRNLDKAYKHLTNTLNMIHEVAKTTDKSMVSPKQKKQLEEVMDKLEVRKTIEDKILDFNKDENLDKNIEAGTPMDLLKIIKGTAKFKETVTDMGIENYFDQRFLSRVTFEVTHGAHTLLNKKKSEAFGGDIKKYNEDCNSRRGMMRRRIFEVYDRNAALNRAASRDRDFADDEDFNRMNSYFTKFPNLFFNSPEDNYDVVNGENPADVNARHFDKMRSVLSALIRRRCPTLRSSHRIRRGSYPKIIVDRARHALKGDQRGIFLWIERQIQWADDSSIIAMTIMLQNQANNKLFFEDKDPFEPKEKRYSKIFKKVAGAEKGRQAVRDKFGPAANFGLKATETVAKGAVAATARTAQKGASMITTPLEKVNGWLSERSNRNPIKLGMIATKPIQWLFNPLAKGVKYKDAEGNEKRMKMTEALKKGYNAGTEALVKEGDEKKTRYLYEWLTRGLESITGFFGNTIADSGQWMQDKYTTASQRNVLGALYDVGQKEDRRKDLMRSGDLANMLDLRNIGPKLFDEDGRILPVDKPAEKYPENEDGMKKLQKDIFGKQHDALQQQISDFLNDIRRKYDSLDNKLDDINPSNPEYENIKKQLVGTGIALDTRNDEQNTINNILAIIQRIGTGNSNLDTAKTEIHQISNTIKNTLDTNELLIDNDDTNHPGIKQKIEKDKKNLKEKQKEKLENETKLSLTTKGDPSTQDLKDKIAELETTITKKNQELRTKTDEIANFKGSIKKNENTNNDLQTRIRNEEQKKRTLSSLLDSINTREIEKAEAEKNIQDPDLTKDEKKNLQKRINALEAKLIGNKKSKDIVDEIKKCTSDINERNTLVINNEANNTSLEINISSLNTEKDVINDSIRKLVIERDQKYTKLGSKSKDDLSWADYTQKKNDLEREIEDLDKSIKKGEKDIEKQEQKNKVYRKIWKRTKTIEEKIDNVIRINSIPSDDKRKLLKKTLENLDLSFEKKIEAPSSSKEVKEQKKEDLANALA